MPSRLPPEPALIWSADGVPSADRFGDAYFSRQGGLAESEAVFLRGCNLPQAWAGRARFAVGELGFGTGLNALAVWRAWRATREAHAVLHMVSIEAFPMGAADAARALAAFPELEPFATKLIERWPVRAFGAQRLWFPEDGFALTIRIGDVGPALDSLSGPFDAWFLDGFAPDRNEAMWGEPLFHRIAALSAPGARVATFTVAGAVRRGLQAAGFKVEKQPGFGAKRERLEAVFPPPAGEVAFAKRTTKGGAFPLYPSCPLNPKRVAVLGAGIAGAACAAALTRRGVETILLDAGGALGAGASGNRAGLVAPRLDRDSSAVAEVFLAAYLDAVLTYRRLGDDVFTPCGLEERPGARGADVISALLADPPLPPDWLRSLGAHSILYPQAGVLKPLSAIRALIRDATLISEAEVRGIERAGLGWRLLAPDGKAWLDADAVVLACGAGLRAFEPAHFLPLQFSRGQIEWGPISGATPTHAELGVCFAAPFEKGLVFGATFDRVDPDAPLKADDASRRRNLLALQRLTPDIAARLNLDALHSRAALRVSTPDRAPIAGLMPNAPAWLQQNAGIAHGRRPDQNLPAPALPGVYVLGALGARGLMLAPLLGELIAALMFGEPQTLSRRALDAIHPARFLHRTLKRSVTMRDKDDGV